MELSIYLLVPIILVLLYLVNKLDNQAAMIDHLKMNIEFLEKEEKLRLEKEEKLRRKQEAETAVEKNNVVSLYDYRNLNSVPSSLAASYSAETVGWVNGMIDAMHRDRVGWPGGKEEIVMWGSEYKEILADDSPVKELANKINITFDYNGWMGGVYPLN
jgi:hypothetical protein